MEEGMREKGVEEGMLEEGVEEDMEERCNGRKGKGRGREYNLRLESFG